jgi:allantoinase
MISPRVEYSPIIERKPFRLPDHARVAVWIIVNAEVWDINSPMPRTLLGGGGHFIPDIPNYSWYDYGLRVGFWRIKGILDQRGIKGTLSLNAASCETTPQIVRECVRSGWEILGHGYVQRILPAEKDEKEIIQKTIRIIKDFTGKAPRGWMGPQLMETWNTPDLLAAEGIEYIADWVNDDEPYPLKVKGGTMIALPYTLELNDIPIHLVFHEPSSGLYDRARAAFDTYYAEGKTRAKIMAISMHPYITGVAHRAGYFAKVLDYIKQHEGVVFMRGVDILDWYNQFANVVSQK